MSARVVSLVAAYPALGWFIVSCVVVLIGDLIRPNGAALFAYGIGALIGLIAFIEAIVQIVKGEVRK